MDLCEIVPSRELPQPEQPVEQAKWVTSDPPSELLAIITPKHSIGAHILQGLKWAGRFFMNLLCSIGVFSVTTGFSGAVGIGLGVAVAAIVGACTVVAPWVTIAIVIGIVVIVGGGLLYGIAQNTFSEIYPKIWENFKLNPFDARSEPEQVLMEPDVDDMEIDDIKPLAKSATDVDVADKIMTQPMAKPTTKGLVLNILKDAAIGAGVIFSALIVIALILFVAMTGLMILDCVGSGPSFGCDFCAFGPTSSALAYMRDPGNLVCGPDFAGNFPVIWRKSDGCVESAKSTNKFTNDAFLKLLTNPDIHEIRCNASNLRPNKLLEALAHDDVIAACTNGRNIVSSRQESRKKGDDFLKLDIHCRNSEELSRLAGVLQKFSAFSHVRVGISFPSRVFRSWKDVAQYFPRHIFVNRATREIGQDPYKNGGYVTLKKRPIAT
ncbi:MAG: hypothetical protein LBF26_00805 [Puniceicoccales bacterium]|nr:hypothetical protein [Puniceicoccales bacterium]